jgi:hypothetical protein
LAGWGQASVRYEIGLFRGEAAQAAVQGHFVHVYVDRATRRPVALPDALKRTLAPPVIWAVCSSMRRSSEVRFRAANRKIFARCEPYRVRPLAAFSGDANNQWEPHTS